jgi:hypothetical protein
MESELATVETQGVSVFVSSGDDGAYAGPIADCGRNSGVTRNAVVVCGIGEVEVESVDDARIEAPTDSPITVRNGIPSSSPASTLTGQQARR